MCVISLCTRGALDAWSRGRSTAALGANSMVEPIATEVLIVQRPNERPFDVILKIGRPEQDSEHPDEWLCPMSLEPLYSNLRAARSNSPVHSLCLAMSLALELLHGVVEDGGSVSLAAGQPFPFEAYAFGVAAGNRGAKKK